MLANEAGRGSQEVNAPRLKVLGKPDFHKVTYTHLNGGVFLNQRMLCLPLTRSKKTTTHFLSVSIGPTYQEGWARTRTGTTHQSTRIAFSFSLPSRLINCMHATSPIYFSIGNRFSSASSPPLRLHLHPNPTAFTLF